MAAPASPCICRNLIEKPSLLEIRHRAESGCLYCRLIYDVVSDLTTIHTRTAHATQISEATAAESHIELLENCVKILWENGEEEYFQIFSSDSFCETTAAFRSQKINNIKSYPKPTRQDD
jgi:hypothetical protein